MKTAVINSKVFMADGYRIDPDIHMSEGVAIRRVLNSLPYPLSTVGDNSERVFLGEIIIYSANIYFEIVGYHLFRQIEPSFKFKCLDT